MKKPVHRSQTYAKYIEMLFRMDSLRLVYIYLRITTAMRSRLVGIKK